MTTVAVSGAAGALGQRLLKHLATLDGIEAIVAVDARPLSDAPAGVRGHVADLETADLKPLLEGVDVLVHLAWRLGTPEDEGEVAARASVEATRRLLDAAGDAGVSHVVHLSSATVYGAWSDNPVPLPETAPLRPNAGAGFPAAKAEAERLVAEWRAAHPSATATVLRPAVTVGMGRESWLARTVGGLRAVRVRGASRPLQFLHGDDLVTAVAAAITQRIDGPCNVAPDGWMADETAKALTTGPLRIGLPRRLALTLTGVPQAYLPYLCHPWVIANDRLRAAGWQPANSNEEALVAGRPASRWQTVSPRRRQEFALGVSVAAIAGAGVAAVALVRRSRRRRA